MFSWRSKKTKVQDQGTDPKDTEFSKSVEEELTDSSVLSDNKDVETVAEVPNDRFTPIGEVSEEEDSEEEKEPTLPEKDDSPTPEKQEVSDLDSDKSSEVSEEDSEAEEVEEKRKTYIPGFTSYEIDPNEEDVWVLTVDGKPFYYTKKEVEIESILWASARKLCTNIRLDNDYNVYIHTVSKDTLEIYASQRFFVVTYEQLLHSMSYKRTRPVREI